MTSGIDVYSKAFDLQDGPGASSQRINSTRGHGFLNMP